MMQVARGRFQCVLLGEETLVVRCAEILLERGHSISALVTTVPAMARWAEEHAIPVLDADSLVAAMVETKVDLLFSITHPARIAADVLERAGYAAINYHDGPLPRYAGINASAWAIANGEANHAIVWHRMTARIDDGDLLERREVKLDPRETSVSLNMRNAALAVESFRTLLGRLERGDDRATPQDRSAARSSYSRHDRPAALTTVDWSAPAAQVDRLIRACDFGNYPNRFGLVKLVHEERAVGVYQSVPIAGSGTPGTVLAIDEAHLDVACGVGALRLGHFVTLTGVAISARDAATTLGLARGEILHDRSRAARDAVSRAVAEAEPFFLEALRDTVSPELPFEMTAAGAPDAVAVPLSPRFTADFTTNFVADAPVTYAALFGVVLSCLLRQDTFDLAVVDEGARAPLAGAAALLFPAAPLRVHIDAGRGFAALLSSLSEAWRRLSRAGGFLADLVARSPELSAGRLARGHLSSLAFLVGDAQLPPGAVLGLAVRRGGLELVSDGRVETSLLRSVASYLVRVAAAVSEEPDRPLARIGLLEAGQRERQLFGWNATLRAYPDRERLHDGFERQAALRPGDVALVCEGQTMSFGEVERRANRIAHALQARGARPGVYVGVIVERGFDLVLALLGVAKSGAAYVPIDIALPPERARLMLTDAGCLMALVSERLRSRAEGICDTLAVDDAEISAAPTSRPACPAASQDVCYAIYTSGSTGAPKGVVLSHRAVVNTLDWFNRTFAVGPTDRLLFVTSPGFDLSVYDVFGALGAGASVEIAMPDLLADPVALARRLCEPGITIWDSAPPALTRLCPFLPVAAPASTLRLVQLSGDWIPVWLPASLQGVFPRASVNSLGGATEAAIWSNHHAVAPIDATRRSIPYGRPIQNARYHVLDHHLRPLPVGMPGELYIGGACLAEGYLDRAELTAERFIADPFRPGERLYRTGDLARYDAGGVLELLGRVDFQVKIRGFRVEVGEIEAAIAASGLVREAVVVAAIADASREKSLVAFVVPRSPTAWQPATLRNLLQRRLPDFMVPSRVVTLDHLPLSANGKVDRRALLEPRVLASSDRVATAPPRNPLERQLVGLWEEVLRRVGIGVHDDFFAIGGHSLLATLLVTRIANRLGVEVPLSQLVSTPTIAGLAALIEARRAGRELDHQYIQSMNLPGNGVPLYLTSGVGGHVFIFQQVAERLSGAHAIHGIRAVGADGERPPCDTLQEVAATYVRELMREPPTGPIALGGYSLGAPVAFELARQLLALGVTVLGLIFVDGYAPGYPRKQPLGHRLSAHWESLRSAPRGTRATILRHRVERLVSQVGEKAGIALFVERYIGFRHDEELLRSMDPRLRRQLERLWMKMHAAGAAYRIARPLSLPLLLLKSGTPFVATIDDPTNGWATVIAGPIEVVRLAGDHEAMLDGPAMGQIGDEIERWLGQLQERAPAVQRATPRALA